MLQGVFANSSTIDRAGSKLLGRRNLSGYIRYGNVSSKDSYVSSKQKKTKKKLGDFFYALKALTVIAAMVAGAYFIHNKGGFKAAYNALKTKVSSASPQFKQFGANMKSKLSNVKNSIFKKGANSAQNAAAQAASNASGASGTVSSANTTKKANIFERAKNFVGSKFKNKSASGAANAASAAASATAPVSNAAASTVGNAAASVTAPVSNAANATASTAAPVSNAASTVTSVSDTASAAAPVSDIAKPVSNPIVSEAQNASLAADSQMPNLPHYELKRELEEDDPIMSKIAKDYADKYANHAKKDMTVDSIDTPVLQGKLADEVDNPIFFADEIDEMNKNSTSEIKRTPVEDEEARRLLHTDDARLSIEKLRKIIDSSSYNAS